MSGVEDILPRLNSHDAQIKECGFMDFSIKRYFFGNINAVSIKPGGIGLAQQSRRNKNKQGNEWEAKAIKASLLNKISSNGHISFNL